MSSDNLITPEEIKTLRASAKTITRKTIIPITPVKLNSGYFVSMTIDMLNDMTVEHVSVSRGGGHTDPADAEIIVKAVIGKCELWGSMFNKDVIHFIKIEEEK